MRRHDQKHQNVCCRKSTAWFLSNKLIGQICHTKNIWPITPFEKFLYRVLFKNDGHLISVDKRTLNPLQINRYKSYMHNYGIKFLQNSKSPAFNIGDNSQYNLDIAIPSPEPSKFETKRSNLTQLMTKGENVTLQN